MPDPNTKVPMKRKTQENVKKLNVCDKILEIFLGLVSMSESSHAAKRTDHKKHAVKCLSVKSMQLLDVICSH